MPDDDFYEDPFLRPGFNPGDARPDMPGVEPAPEPPVEDVPDEGGLGSSGAISGSDDDLTGSTEDYSDLTCVRCSTNWIDAPEQDCFQAVQITATRTNGNSVLLTGDDGTDAMYFSMNQNSYAEFNIRLNISGGRFGDYVEIIPVRFDGGDSLNLQIDSTGFQFFELIKDGQQWISSQTIAALNSNFTKFEVEITLKKAFYCIVPEPLPEIELTEDEEAAISGTGQYSQSEAVDDTGGSWSQEDSWVLIGGLVLLGIAYYLYNTVGGSLDE